MRKVKLLCIVLTSVFVTGAVVNNVAVKTMAVEQGAIDDAAEELRQAQERLDKIKSELEALSSNISDTEGYITQIDQKLGEYTAQLVDYQQKIAAKQQDIDKKIVEIDKKAAEIEEKKDKLDIIQAQQRADYESMKSRIQYMYECGDESFLEMLFSSEDLSDMLGTAEYVNNIVEYDRKQLEKLANAEASMADLVAKLEADIKQLQNDKKILDNEKASLVSMEKDVESQRSYIDTILQSKKETLETLKQQQNQAASAESMIEKEIAEKQAVYDRLKAQWEEERKKAEQQGINVEEAVTKTLEDIGLSGGFKMPLAPDYTCGGATRTNYLISSVCGISRYIPSLGIYGNTHSGLDFPADFGVPILAVYGGTVVEVQSSPGGFGNYVVVEHGIGVKTLYAHMSNFECYVGQRVEAGQMIGRVGSTGASTGAHLHLSLLISGVYTDIMPYYSESAAQAAQMGLTGVLPDQMPDYKGIPFEFTWNVYE